MSKLQIKNLPSQYQKIWDKALPLLAKGRPGDDAHAQETVEMILDYQGKIKFHPEIVIPAAMMHDIGHYAILPEHFRYVTGPEKIPNAKLVHMLAGAKIAHDILVSVKYDPALTEKIVEIISMHDADQMKNMNLAKIYNNTDKKFFHDMDSLDRYNEKRLKNISGIYSDRGVILQMLEKFLDLFFYAEFRKKAEEGLKELKSRSD